MRVLMTLNIYKQDFTPIFWDMYRNIGLTPIAF